MKWLVLIAVAAASGSSLTFLLWRSTASSPEPVPTSTRLDSRGTKVIEGIGYVEPASEVRQLSPKTGGVIKACYVKVGDVVRKGDPILTLHDEKEAATVVLARKQLEVARADEAQVKSGINQYRIRAAEKKPSPATRPNTTTPPRRPPGPKGWSGAGRYRSPKWRRPTPSVCRRLRPCTRPRPSCCTSRTTSGTWTKR